MKMTKRFLAILAAILCLVFVFSTVSFADGYNQNIQWYLDDNGVLTITGSGAMSNFTAKSTNEWLSMKDMITAVVIEEGVTTVGSYAFTGCTNLQSVCIPASVTTIGNYAFNGCYALQSVYFAGYSSTFSGNPFSNKPTVYCHEHAWVDYWANNQGCAVIYLDSISERDLVIMTLEPAQMLGVGESRTISYQLFPACWRNNISWRVSNTNIASIDQDGTLTGRKAGTVRVTATVAGNTYTTDVQVINGYNYGGNYGGNYGYNNSLYILTQPQSATFKNNTDVWLTVDASGVGLTYQWASRTKTGSWKNMTSSDSRTSGIRVRATTAMDGMQYRCTVNDRYGNSVTSEIATLTLAKNLKITTQPTAQSVTEGMTAVFSVAATGDGVCYQWQERMNGSAWKACAATGATSATLQVSTTRAMNGTQYRCRLTDAYGASATSNTVTLAVKARVALVINKQPVDKTGRNNTVVQFNVEASGAGVTYQWQERPYNSQWQNSAERGNNTKCLSVVASTYKDGYQYRCVVSDNTGSSIISNVATLYMQGTTTPVPAASLAITRQPSSVSVQAGGSAQFAVSATGNGLTYRWLESTNNGYINSAEYGFNTPTLTVTASDNKNGRRYCCVVTDSYGNKVTSAAATLSVVAQPTAAPLPTLSIVSQPRDAYGTPGSFVQFQIQANGTGLRYQWQVLPTGGNWKDTHANGYNTNTLPYPAELLLNGYQLRCVVTDAYGNTCVSNAATLVVR